MRIALIHALEVAIPPIEAAFKRHWPEAERFNLMDDKLSVDRSRNVETSSRIGALADYALGADAAGILYTCSAFGEAIDAVKRRSKVPVLKPSEAMFDEARKRGKRIGLLATFAPSIPSMEAEFGGPLQSACAEGAMAALQAGDGAKHDALCAAAAKNLADCDVIMLAQFSTARARDAVAAAVSCPVLTSPDSAVLRMKGAF